MKKHILLYLKIFQADKVFNLIIFLFLLYLSIYVGNPYLNNLGDFITTTPPVIYIGCILIIALQIYFATFYNKKVASQLLDRTMQKKAYIISSIVYFTVIFLVYVAILLIYLIFFLDYSLGMLETYLNLSLNYIVLPYILSILLGYLIGGYIDKIKTLFIIVGYSVSIFLIFPSILDVSMHTYYQPFSGLFNFYPRLIGKLVIGLSLLLMLMLLVKSKKNTSYKLLFTAIISLLVLSLFNKHNDAEALKDYYNLQYFKELSELQSTEDAEKIQIDDNSSYKIDSYNIELNDGVENINIVVDIQLSMIEKNRLVFYLDDEFKIEKISQGNSKLDYKRKGNKLTLELDNYIKEETITFNYSGKGSSMAPVNKEYIFLPEFYNWYPRQIDDFNLTLLDNSSLKPSPSKKTCNSPKNVKSDVEGIYIVGNKKSNCITVLKGDFTYINRNSTEYLIPKSWLGDIQLWKYNDAYKDLINYYNEIFSENIERDVVTIIIMPKNEFSPTNLVSDLRTNKGNHIMFMDPFLNIFEVPLHRQINKKLTYNIVYDIFRDRITADNEPLIKKMSILFGVHINKYYKHSSEISINLEQMTTEEQEEIYDFLNKNKKDQVKELRRIFNLIIEN